MASNKIIRKCDVLVRQYMEISWIHNDFNCKAMHGPFVVEKGIDYYDDLMDRYNMVIKQAEKSGADRESIGIIKRFKKKILEAIRSYCKADVAKCNTIIKNLVKEVGKNTFAVDEVQNSQAFLGDHATELQFFRGRIGNPSSKSFAEKDMLHLPFSLRAKSGNYRFSIPGNPSMYLANSSYGCWIELGMPADNEFNVSPVLLDGTQKVLNLTVSFLDKWEDFECLDYEQFLCWLELCMLSMATSYKITETERKFKSEYIVSQAIMMACKKLKFDGLAYCSKRVSSDTFALPAINLALFVNYNGEYSDIVSHMKMDNAYNYGMYKQLLPSLDYKKYNLRSVNTGYVTNIGSWERQYPYKETRFYEFDQFLFASWRDKPDGKGKDQIPFGVPIV